ncbi:hypothetical protein FHL15_010145 [Xylaria flabelliformis]|uniref:Uncharacterized protein n=1 Tax=Xylaria flabelliformis TaxID=2512241 RepID=A0A553HLX0_9PEZI|nr:hypothetical protein FHL15_010145 [Xylaria flabelliformis]
MSSIGPGKRQCVYPAMAIAKRQRPVLIDLTRDGSDDDLDANEAAPSHQSAITDGEGKDEQDLVSEDEEMDDNQSSGSIHLVSDIKFVEPPCAYFSPASITRRNMCVLPTPEEPSEHNETSPTEEAQSLHAVGEDDAPSEHYFGGSSDIADDDAERRPIEEFVKSPDNYQDTSGNDSDTPWDVFHSFLTIQRADFDSGKEFLQACEKLRQKILVTWNLQFTQKFTHTLFINAMRSHDPFLADVLRRVQLAGDLEFHDLKRIIRMNDVTEDIMIGHQMWGEWMDAGLDEDEDLDSI